MTAKKQHTIPFESPPEEGTHRPPALVTRNLVKAYGSRKVLRGITFAAFLAWNRRHCLCRSGQALMPVLPLA